MSSVEASFTAQRLIRPVTPEVINVIWVNPGKNGALSGETTSHTPLRLSHERSNTLGERLRSVTVCMVR